MRLPIIFLLLLLTGLGWWTWRGIDLATGWLARTTVEEPGTRVPDGAEPTAAEQGPDPMEAALDLASKETGTAMLEPARSPAQEQAAAGTAAMPGGASEEPATRSPEAAPETASSSADRRVSEAVPDPAAIAATAPDSRRVTGDRVNLRQGPEVGTTSLDLLSLDTTVEVLEARGDWLRVRTETGEEGWIAARFLAPTQG